MQDLDYTWDTLGNLTSREEKSGSKNLSESFTYDGLNRLSTQSVAGQSTVTVAYDANGNNVGGDGRSLEYTTFDKPEESATSRYLVVRSLV